MRIIRTSVMFVLAVALIGACAPIGGSSTRGIRALATTTIFAEMAARVAGDRARVESIAPAGAHVEEYEPKPDDAKRVSEASVIFVNGRDLDKWVEPLLKNARTDARVVRLTEDLPDIEDNPHMWFDVSLARKHVEKMRDTFAAADPSDRDGYAARAKVYDEELAKLDAEIRTKVATIPQSRRKLVTSHDQFPYFAKAYGFEIVGFAQPEPGKDPSPSELAALVEKIKAAKVPAIFSESGLSPRLAETLAKEAGVTKVVSDLPTDSLMDKPADTYVGYMRVIVDKIVAALK
jgi:ABC-type Zn uptake system ZnuABC Zn-binding protein ZnuA